MRKLIKEADPDVVEEWKWMGTPIWSHDGILCTGESYKNVVKLTFSKGASLKDPARLFNSSLDGNSWGNHNGLDMYGLGLTIVGAYDRDLLSGIFSWLVLVVKVEGSLCIRDV
jgi:hypothetical protein